MRLCPTVLSIFVCSLSKLSEINAKIRNICEKNLSVVYAKDTMLGDVCLTDYFSSESIFFLNEAKWDEIRKQNSKGNNEYGPKNELKRLL